MDVTILDPLADPRWTELVRVHPDAGIFHDPSWLALLKAVYGYSPLVVALREGRDIIGGIPFMPIKSSITGKRWVAVPFSDHCRPLLPGSTAEGPALIGDFLRSSIGKTLPLIEVRWGLQPVNQGYRREEFVLHRLQLMGSPEEIFKRFKKTQVQQPILKAEREGVTVHPCKNAEQFRQFYRLQLLTRRRLGVPAQPRKFFDLLWSRILEPGLGVGLLAMREGVPIAGAVFLRYKRVLTYKYAASDSRFREWKGNDAVLWSAIHTASLEDFEWVDLGRTEKENEGLRRFKSAWGGQEEPLPYTYFASEMPAQRKGRGNSLANFVIRNSPTFVCRFAGEILYRHYG